MKARKSAVTWKKKKRKENRFKRRKRPEASQVSFNLIRLCLCLKTPEPSGQHVWSLTDCTCRSTTTRWMSSLKTSHLCTWRKTDGVHFKKKERKRNVRTCDVNYKDINYGGNICHYGNIKHMMYIEFDHKAYKMLAYLPYVIDTSPLCYCINCGLASHSHPLNPHKPTSPKSPPCYFFFSPL